MIVICPNCKTKFNLPDEVAKPGAKLRCSICKFTFSLNGDAPKQSSPSPEIPSLEDMVEQSPDTGEDSQSFLKRKGIVLFILLLLVAGGAGYAVWTLTPIAETIHALLTPEQKVNPADLVKHIALRGVRQYNVNNEKIGNISVIEGKTVNGFPEPRELIRVEAALYDASGNLLVSKNQFAGTSVSLFQLRVLGDQELEQALANKIDILTNNTNVQPGGEVPFMIIFYAPPDKATEFGVKVIDVRVPPIRKD